MINDEEVVPLLLSKGATFEEALDYAVSGCAEARMPNRDTYTSGCAYINFAAALEMTLYSGKIEESGDEQIGMQTGDPRSFKAWEEFYNAYLAHQTDYIKQAFIQQHHIIRLRARRFPGLTWARRCTTCAWRVASTCTSPRFRAASTWGISNSSVTALWSIPSRRSKSWFSKRKS